MKSTRNSWLGAGSIAALATTFLAASANAAITYHLITNDATSGISTSNTYTHKLDFDTTELAGGGATVNGVVFDRSDTSGFNATYSGAQATNNTGTANSASIGGGVGGLLQGFLLRGSTITAGLTNTLTLTGLTEGTQYDFRIYSGRWNTTLGRTNTIRFDPDGAGAISDITPTIDQTNPTAIGFSGADVYYINYNYTADASGQLVVDFTTTGTGGSWHIYGVTNQVVIPEPSGALLGLVGGLGLILRRRR